MKATGIKSVMSSLKQKTDSSKVAEISDTLVREKNEVEEETKEKKTSESSVTMETMETKAFSKEGESKVSDVSTVDKILPEVSKLKPFCATAAKNTEGNKDFELSKANFKATESKTKNASGFEILNLKSTEFRQVSENKKPFDMVAEDEAKSST